jgi:hypothetical protein
MPINILAYDEMEHGYPACGPIISKEYARHFGLFYDLFPQLQLKQTDDAIASGEKFAYMIFWRHTYGYPRSVDECAAVTAGFDWMRGTKVLEAIKKGQGFLVIFDWFEGDRYDDSVVYTYHDKFKTLIELLDVSPKQIIFANGNAKLKEEETPDTPHFVYENFWNISFWNHRPGIIKHPVNKPYRYLSYARHWNSMRQYFTFELYKRDMLKYGLVSLGQSHAFEIPDPKLMEEQQEYFVRMVNAYVPDATREEAQEFLNMLPLELDVNLEENQAGSMNLEHHLQSDLSIVHETDTHFLTVQNKGLFLSEKIYRPLLLGHPFLVMGPQHTLKQLRAEGFKTFHPIIDESYDDEPNAIERKNKIIAELQKYIALPEEERLAKNRKLLMVADYNQKYYSSPRRPTFGHNLMEIFNVL